MMPAFLAQRPRLFWRAGERYPLVSPDLRAASPALAEDFDVLDRELLPDFYELDESALRAQNTFRLGQLVVILGGAAATSLGAVQAALGGGSRRSESRRRLSRVRSQPLLRTSAGGRRSGSTSPRDSRPSGCVASTSSFSPACLPTT
jgi:hypothetical protein